MDPRAGLHDRLRHNSRWRPQTSLHSRLPRPRRPNRPPTLASHRQYVFPLPLKSLINKSTTNTDRDLHSLWVVPPLFRSWHLGWAYDSDTNVLNETEREKDVDRKPGSGSSGIGDGSARKEIERLWAIGSRKVGKVRRRRPWKRWEGRLVGM
jgi:hypothetical protein